MLCGSTDHKLAYGVEECVEYRDDGVCRFVMAGEHQEGVELGRCCRMDPVQECLCLMGLIHISEGGGEPAQDQVIVHAVWVEAGIPEDISEGIVFCGHTCRVCIVDLIRKITYVLNNDKKLKSMCRV